MSSCHVLFPSLDYQFILDLHQPFTKVKNYHAGIADNNRHRRSERRSVGGGGRLLDGRSHLSRASPFQTISPYSQNDNQEVIIFVVVKPDFFFFHRLMQIRATIFTSSYTQGTLNITYLISPRNTGIYSLFSEKVPIIFATVTRVTGPKAQIDIIQILE